MSPMLETEFYSNSSFELMFNETIGFMQACAKRMLSNSFIVSGYLV